MRQSTPAGRSNQRYDSAIRHDDDEMPFGARHDDLGGVLRYARSGARERHFEELHGSQPASLADAKADTDRVRPSEQLPPAHVRPTHERSGLVEGLVVG